MKYCEHCTMYSHPRGSPKGYKEYRMFVYPPGKKLIHRILYYKSLRLEYDTNGNLKQKTFSRTEGCNHIKKRWRKFYSENGKLTSKDK